LHCNAPYEVSVSNRGFVSRIWYKKVTNFGLNNPFNRLNHLRRSGTASGWAKLDGCEYATT
jgi:hypothetical protein